MLGRIERVALVVTPKSNVLQ